MKVLTQRALRVFAVLEDYRAGSPDILDAILPFFEPILASHSGEILNQNELAQEVRQTYQWNVTADIVEELIPRFKNKGWVEQGASTDEAAAYHIICSSKPSSDALAETSDAHETLLSIAVHFQEFVTDLSPITAFDRSQEELADVLVEWLISADAYSEDVLLRQAKNEITTEGTLSIDPDLAEASRGSTEEKYLCARFVKHMIDTNSPYIEALCKIASIGLLTEVVQDFQKPITSVKQTDLVVYLDAPVALDLLGTSGNAAASNIRPIVKQLQGIGATVRALRVSVEELRQALEAILRRPAAERIGPTADALRRGDVLEAYIREVARDPEAALRKFGIRVVDRNLDQFPNEHEYFTQNDYEHLVARMTWHRDMPRREHDATAIALVVRMRRDRQSPDLFSTRHVLVTRNGALVHSARRFCLEHDLVHGNCVGPAVHQRQLATAVWLRTGLRNEEQEEVPRRYLLAACERVLALKKSVVEQVRLTAKGLTTEQAEQLDLLLSQDRSSQMLMDKTLGISHVISSANIERLIDVMKASLVDDIEKEKSAEVREIRREANKKIKTEKDARAAAEYEAKSLRDNIYSLDKEDERIVRILVDEVNTSMGRRYSAARLVVFLVVLAIGILPAYAGIADGTLQLLAMCATGVVASALAYFQLLDKPLGISARLENWGQKRLSVLAEKRGATTKLGKFKLAIEDRRIAISKVHDRDDLGL